MRSDHRHLTAYQIGCEVGQSLDLVLRPAILDHDIVALDVAGFTNPLPEGGQITCTIGKRRTAEETDHRYRRLLRPRRERPSRRTAEQRYEFAPSHVRGAAPLDAPGQTIAHRPDARCTTEFQFGFRRLWVNSGPLRMSAA